MTVALQSFNFSRTIALHQRHPQLSLCQQCRRKLTARPLAPLHGHTLQTRLISTSRPPPSYIRSLLTRFKNLIIGTTISASLVVGYAYVTDTRSSIHALVPPILRLLYPDAEDSHHAGNATLHTLRRFNLHPRERGNNDENDLAVSVLDTILSSPLAISAGLDKDGEIPDALFDLGPSIVEIGGVTPLPQQGNPRPRVFRLPSQNALINRYGLNSSGADHVALLLRQRVRKFAYTLGLGGGEEGENAVLNGQIAVDGGIEEEGIGGGYYNPGSLRKGALLAIQIAKNAATPANDVEKVVQDYRYCVDRLGKYADILVVNVSSPNTPGLRGLQAAEPLSRILAAVVDAAARVDRGRGRKGRKPAVLVKVSPDESSMDQIEGVCAAVWEAGVDGVVVGNTTTKRPLSERRQGGIDGGLRREDVETMRETGGYSGPEMFERTRALVWRYRMVLDEMGGFDEAGGQRGKGREDRPKVIFASGGITDGVRALQVLEAGASVAMVYTGMVYGGAGTVTRMKRELRTEMKRRIEEARSAEEGKR